MKILTIAGGILLFAGASAVANAAPATSTSVRVANGPAMANGPHWPSVGPVRGLYSPDNRGDHRRRHRGDRIRYWPVYGYGGSGNGGYVYSEITPDMFGYFGTGGDVELVDGEAIYDYDRSYPYEWYRQDDRRDMAGDTASARPDGYRCHTSWVPDGSRKDVSPVRVCRR